MNLTFPLPDDIEEYNCIPIQGREFGGSWDDNKISYISLAVYLCENGANFGENEYCATEEEITQLFKKQTQSVKEIETLEITIPIPQRKMKKKHLFTFLDEEE